MSLEHVKHKGHALLGRRAVRLKFAGRGHEARKTLMARAVGNQLLTQGENHPGSQQKPEILLVLK